MGVQTEVGGIDVSAWGDQSGNDRHAHTLFDDEVTAEYPALVFQFGVLGGSSSIRFSTISVMGFDGTFLAGSDYTIFVLEGRDRAGLDNFFIGTTNACSAAEPCDPNGLLGLGHTNSPFNGAAFLKLGWREILGFGLGFLVGESFLWVVFLPVFPSQPRPLEQLLYVPLVFFVGLGLASVVGTAFVRFSWTTIWIGAGAFGVGSAAGGFVNSLLHLLLFSFFPAYLSWPSPGPEGDLMDTLGYSAIGLVFIVLPHALGGAMLAARLEEIR